MVLVTIVVYISYRILVINIIIADCPQPTKQKYRIYELNEFGIFEATYIRGAYSKKTFKRLPPCHNVLLRLQQIARIAPRPRLSLRTRSVLPKSARIISKYEGEIRSKKDKKKNNKHDEY